jgi:uncharacterized protein
MASQAPVRHYPPRVDSAEVPCRPRPPAAVARRSFWSPKLEVRSREPTMIPAVRIVIAGGTGFLGTALAATLRADGHDLVVLTRQTGTLPRELAPWTPDGTAGPWARVIDGAGAVINLAGAALDEKRWTEPRKRVLVESRVLPTRSLVQAIGAAARPPSVFLSSSAVGYYGARGDHVVTEDGAAGSDFLARLVTQWENEAEAAASTHTRVALLRSGIVLAPDGGALGRMLWPFKLGVGGPFGNGRQYMSWIHRQDWVGMARWLLATPEANGPFNAVAPAPVTNEVFAATLARVLRRPHLLRAPRFALRLALGEMADAALLAGQRAVPAKAQALGFRFRWPELEAALRDLLAS